MSHVDEGRLHAYLDGAFVEGDAERAQLEAHLALCEDCRTRLEDARRVKQRAHEALDHLAPEPMPMASWDDVLERHGSHGGGSGGASPAKPGTWVPMAWAASLMLALGAGWMANQLFVSEQAGTLADAPASQALPGAPVAEPEEERLRPPVESDELFRGDRSQRASRQRAEPPTDPDVAGGVGRAAATPPIAAGSAAISGRQAEATMARRTLDLVQPSAEEKAMLPATVFADAPADSLERLAELGNDLGASAGTLLRGYAEATRTDAWRTISMAEAAEQLGRAPAAIDSVQVDSVQLAERGDTVVVRTLQRLEDGTPVELLHTRAIAVPGIATLRQEQMLRQSNVAEAADLQLRERTMVVAGARVLPLDVSSLTVIMITNLPAERIPEIVRRVR